MFKKRYTKWIPFGNYNFGYSSYIVLARKNIKTGMLQFKTKTPGSRWARKDSFVPIGLIDVKKQWEELTTLI